MPANHPRHGQRKQGERRVLLGRQPSLKPGSESLSRLASGSTKCMRSFIWDQLQAIRWNITRLRREPQFIIAGDVLQIVDPCINMWRR